MSTTRSSHNPITSVPSSNKNSSPQKTRYISPTFRSSVFPHPETQPSERSTANPRSVRTPNQHKSQTEETLKGGLFEKVKQTVEKSSGKKQFKPQSIHIDPAERMSIMKEDYKRALEKSEKKRHDSLLKRKPTEESQQEYESFQKDISATAFKKQTEAREAKQSYRNELWNQIQEKKKRFVSDLDEIHKSNHRRHVSQLNVGGNSPSRRDFSSTTTNKAAQLETTPDERRSLMDKEWRAIKMKSIVDSNKGSMSLRSVLYDQVKTQSHKNLRELSANSKKESSEEKDKKTVPKVEIQEEVSPVEPLKEEMKKLPLESSERGNQSPSHDRSPSQKTPIHLIQQEYERKRNLIKQYVPLRKEKQELSRRNATPLGTKSKSMSKSNYVVETLSRENPEETIKNIANFNQLNQQDKVIKLVNDQEENSQKEEQTIKLITLEGEASKRGTEKETSTEQYTFRKDTQAMTLEDEERKTERRDLMNSFVEKRDNLLFYLKGLRERIGVEREKNAKRLELLKEKKVRKGPEEAVAAKSLKPNNVKPLSSVNKKPVVSSPEKRQAKTPIKSVSKTSVVKGF